VAVSADGNTALSGGYADNGGNIQQGVGAAWVFTRSAGIWAQEGSKLVGGGNIGAAWQGFSVALSGDGNTALVGGPNDNGDLGAAWVFVQRTKDDCKNAGWLNFPSPPGPFTNQGQCVSSFAK
jgi:hypothetical protein